MSRFYLPSRLLTTQVLLLTCVHSTFAFSESEKVQQLPEEVVFLSDGRTKSTRCSGYDKFSGRNRGVSDAQLLAREDALTANKSVINSYFASATNCLESSKSSKCASTYKKYTELVSSGFLERATKQTTDYSDNIVCVTLTGTIVLPEINKSDFAGSEHSTSKNDSKFNPNPLPDWIGIDLVESDDWQAKIKVDCLDKSKVCGEIYFSSLRCAGTLTYLGQKYGKFVFKENLEYGNCVNGCELHLEKDGSAYSEFCNKKMEGGGSLYR